MKKFIIRLFLSALFGLAAGTISQAKLKWDFILTFEIAFGLMVVLLIVLLPFRRWKRKRVAARQDQMLESFAQQQWSDYQLKMKDNGGLLPVEAPCELLNADEIAYYYGKVDMGVTDEFAIMQGCESKVKEGIGISQAMCDIVGDSDEAWDFYGEVDLLVTNRGISVVFADGGVESLDLDTMRKFAATRNAVIIRGKHSEWDSEPSYVFEAENGYLVMGIVQTVVRKLRSVERARERELASDRITNKQMDFIKRLGGKPDRSLSKQDASRIIESLLAEKKGKRS